MLNPVSVHYLTCKMCFYVRILIPEEISHGSLNAKDIDLTFRVTAAPTNKPGELNSLSTWKLTLRLRMWLYNSS